MQCPTALAEGHTFPLSRYRRGSPAGPGDVCVAGGISGRKQSPSPGGTVQHFYRVKPPGLDVAGRAEGVCAMQLLR